MVHLLGHYLFIVQILVENIKLEFTYWITNNNNSHIELQHTPKCWENEIQWPSEILKIKTRLAYSLKIDGHIKQKLE